MCGTRTELPGAAPAPAPKPPPSAPVPPPPAAPAPFPSAHAFPPQPAAPVPPPAGPRAPSRAAPPRTARLESQPVDFIVPPPVHPVEPQPFHAPTRPLPVDRHASIPPLEAASIPATPRPVRIVLGGLFLLVTLWLVLFFLPRHKPLSSAAEAELAARAGQAEVLRQRELRLSEEVHIGGNVGAVALALAGIGLIVSGALYRPQAHVRCRRCLRPVLAWKGPFGLHCPLGEHYARIQWLLVVLTALFWSGLLILAAVILLWLA